MSTQDIMESTRRALEESFFAKENAALIEKMRKKTETEGAKTALKAAAGISDDKIITSLIEAGITSSTFAALALAPLVLVAWADGKLDDKEHDAITKAMRSSGVAQGTEAADLIESWLNKAPDPSLTQTWTAYISGLRAVIGEAETDRLRSEIMGRAETVAKAAGGFLGLKDPISAAEAKVLKQLSAAF